MRSSLVPPLDSYSRCSAVCTRSDPPPLLPHAVNRVYCRLLAALSDPGELGLGLSPSPCCCTRSLAGLEPVNEGVGGCQQMRCHDARLLGSSETWRRDAVAAGDPTRPEARVSAAYSSSPIESLAKARALE